MQRASLLPVMLLSAAAGFGCHRRPQTSPPAIASDSIRGTVSVTGTAFEQQLVLRSESGATILSAGTADSAALTRLGGVEVLAMGTREASRFRVNRFTAVSVAGSPVVDGIVREEGGRLMIETGNDRIPLGNPPAALRRLIGGRVWIGGPTDSGPNTFGIIVPPQ